MIVRAHACRHANNCACTSKRARTHIHAYTYTCPLIHIHAHIHIHPTHTHTCTCTTHRRMHNAQAHHAAHTHTCMHLQIHAGAQSPTQTPLPPRGCAHAHRPSSTSATPAFVTPCDPAPGSTHSTPPFHTPPSRPDSNGRAGSDRRSSSGVPGGHSYLLRLQREARARHAAAAAEVGSPTLATGGNTAAAPACGPSLIRSPCSPSVSMRSADAGSPPDAPITLLHPHRPLSHNPGTPREDLGASCSSSGSSSGRCSWQQQAARQIAAPLMRSVPTHIAFSPSTCASSADRGSPMQCERAEDMLPLKQLSVLRQSRWGRRGEGAGQGMEGGGRGKSLPMGCSHACGLCQGGTLYCSVTGQAGSVRACTYVCVYA